MNRSFSSGLSWYRKMRGLSADECAKELGVSKSTLLNIEQNHGNPTLDTVALIAANMGVDPRFLLFPDQGPDLSASMLMMDCLGPKWYFSLDTLYQITAHLQAAMDLIVQAQMQASAANEEEPTQR